MIATRKKDLWSLVKYQPYVDSSELAEAIQVEAAQGSLDFRTRLLIRDSVDALVSRWNKERFARWLERSPSRESIEAICREELGDPGFPTIARRIVEKTDPEDIRRYLRDLGNQVPRPVRLLLGGSAPLILSEQLVRNTDDLDIVDELPAEVRTLHKLLHELKERYGLSLAHFQSHYLPGGWETRLHSLGSFGKLQVFLVDGHDVYVSKLFSNRIKDRNDLQVLVKVMDKETAARRVRECTVGLRADEKLREAAEHNWYVLYGEALPS